MATSTLNTETLESLGTAQDGNSETQIEKPNKTKNRLMIIINCAFATIGVVGGPLLVRLYYLHGGTRKWLTSFLQSAGFPILIFPLMFLFIQSKLSTRKDVQISSSFCIEPKLFLSSAAIGVLFGVDNFMYSLGLSYLPVSTATILFATNLCFVAFFSWLIVKQKFTAFIINAVVVMTLGSVLLGINIDGDRPTGVSKCHYLWGFLLTLVAAALAGLMLPFIELALLKATRKITYSSLMQFQFILSLFATIVCVIGMLVNKDFQAIPREANEFDLGKAKYYIIMVVTAIVWQLTTVGLVGIIFYTSALFNGIFAAVLVPFTGVAAVICYHENFTGLKGMALALCLWGFCSYFYGEYKMLHKVTNNETPKTIEKVENELKRLDDHEEP
uniref:Probable purine permease n=1 Tax=Papaver somniferum TaxID=3469 RepID=A0A5B7LJB4_PAPSO|nr:purine permease [Papaver somniferum]